MHRRAGIAAIVVLVAGGCALAAWAISVAPRPAAGATAAERPLLFPLPESERRGLRDSFHDACGGRVVAARGTPVHAVDEGRVVKLFWSDRGGKTVYQFDPAERVSYYYAHLDRYADGLVEGARVKRGEVIGYVGSTGNAAEAGPHLHFAIARLGPKREWWKGEPIDPYPLLASAPAP